ncbi:MAG: hypothetical protein HQK52_02795 [Oligoflexia bacterium]|nr:hypothetical protein [Oligoflexia bacterium]
MQGSISPGPSKMVDPMGGSNARAGGVSVRVKNIPTAGQVLGAGMSGQGQLVNMDGGGDLASVFGQLLEGEKLKLENPVINRDDLEKAENPQISIFHKKNTNNGKNKIKNIDKDFREDIFGISQQMQLNSSNPIIDKGTLLVKAEKKPFFVHAMDSNIGAKTIGKLPVTNSKATDVLLQDVLKNKGKGNDKDKDKDKGEGKEEIDEVGMPVFSSKGPVDNNFFKLQLPKSTHLKYQALPMGDAPVMDSQLSGIDQTMGDGGGYQKIANSSGEDNRSIFVKKNRPLVKMSVDSKVVESVDDPMGIIKSGEINLKELLANNANGSAAKKQESLNAFNAYNGKDNQSFNMSKDVSQLNANTNANLSNQVNMLESPNTSLLPTFSVENYSEKNSEDNLKLLNTSSNTKMTPDVMAGPRNGTIDRVNNYIVQLASSNENNVSVNVEDKELGSIEIHLEKIKGSRNEIDIQIRPQERIGSDFFVKHKDELLLKLENSGVKVSDFKIDHAMNSLQLFSGDLGSQFQQRHRNGNEEFKNQGWMNEDYKMHYQQKDDEGGSKGQQQQQNRRNFKAYYQELYNS